MERRSTFSSKSNSSPRNQNFSSPRSQSISPRSQTEIEILEKNIEIKVFNF